MQGTEEEARTGLHYIYLSTSVAPPPPPLISVVARRKKGGSTERGLLMYITSINGSY